MNGYKLWEARQGINEVSPEAYYAEAAWNAALTLAANILLVPGGKRAEEAAKEVFALRTKTSG